MEYNKYIDYTNLKSPPSKQIRRLVEEAEDKGYYGVCLCYQDVRVAKKFAKTVKIITVLGFPPISAYSLIDGHNDRYIWLGLYSTKSMSYIREVCEDSKVDEIDVVFPFYWYSQGYYKRITNFLRGIKKLSNKPVKVIIELGTIFKSPEHIERVCNILKESGVDYLKTNTGLIKQEFFSLTAHISIAMQYTELPIKASGGINSEKKINDLVSAGVKRIGTSSIKNY